MVESTWKIEACVAKCMDCGAYVVCRYDVQPIMGDGISICLYIFSVISFCSAAVLQTFAL